ncbi:hypothetical protein HK100_010848 [Physocladia obscura]|uniref:tRNA-binding domain-containing protein n=1 Tax=Physocladia obscura TaxID=109957 RepID=A0AAD5T4Z2_9FUNG|nr:hypothetical protein HK100_010848 [Physocladia obscura]
MESFLRLDLRIVRIITAEAFPAARNPSYKLSLEIGAGQRVQSSAQLTKGYADPSLLVGKLGVAVVNFPARRIAGLNSQALLTGMYADESRVFLVQPQTEVDATLADSIAAGSRVLLLDTVTGEIIGQDHQRDNVPLASIDDLMQCQFALTINRSIGLGGYDEQILVVKSLQGNLVPLTTGTEVPIGTSLK